MSRKTIRILLSVVVIGGAFTALLATSLKEDAQYYKHVDEVMPQAAAWYGKTLQLHGFVEAGSIQVNRSTLDRRFRVTTGDSGVLATYTGVVPDTFKDGAEVVLTGKLSAAGFHVQPGGISMKCPSRYDPEKGS